MSSPVAVLNVYRGQKGDEPRHDRFEIPFEPGLTVLDALTIIYRGYDQSLAFRASCHCSYCGACAVRIDGRPALACRTWLRPEMTIEPLDPGRLVRDLVMTGGVGSDR